MERPKTYLRFFDTFEVRASHPQQKIEKTYGRAVEPFRPIHQDSMQ